MEQRCRKCAEAFQIDEVDLFFYERAAPAVGRERIPIPLPALCPHCREQRRMCWRNERSLYQRKCDRSGASLVSVYPPAAPFPVWESTLWWREDHNALEFGREIDFGRPLMPQLAELQRVVPRSHTFNYADARLENSRYTNCAGDLKNCYLIFGAARDERCCYGTYVDECYLCLDSFFVRQSRGCYQCIDVRNCENLFYGQNCGECRDSRYLYDCRGCADCMACAGLRRKQHHILNKPLGQAQYRREKARILSNPGALCTLLLEYERLKLAAPRRCYSGDLNENVTGDSINSSKNCRDCFDTYDAEDCRWCTWFGRGRDCMDFTAWGEAELCYEVCAGGEAMYGCLFTAQSFGCRECLYCDACVYCKNCFACVGLKNERYCILNRRCTPEEYARRALGLIELMRRGGEWGEFFPPALAPHGYNETIAQEHYPLTRDEALAQGFNWLDYEPPAPAGLRRIEAADLPADIASAGDDILTCAIACEATGKLFRITAEELSFYRGAGLPLPRRHPDRRHADRLGLRNPHRLWQRPCAECAAAMLTSYAPERPEQVFCEACYLKRVY